MTLGRVVSALVTLGFCGAALGAQAQLTLLTTVVDRATGMPAEALTPSDVRVTEDGAAASVVKVEPVTRSVKLQVLIDNGIGTGRNIVELRNGVRKLAEGLPAAVETTLVTTAPNPRFLVRATTNRDELLKGVDRLTPDTGSGSFVESLTEAAQRANRAKDRSGKTASRQHATVPCDRAAP